MQGHRAYGMDELEVSTAIIMSTIYERLSVAQQQGDAKLVEELKELKNSVIGNVLRKVQVAEDGDVLRL